MGVAGPLGREESAIGDDDPGPRAICPCMGSPDVVYWQGEARDNGPGENQPRRKRRSIQRPLGSWVEITVIKYIGNHILAAIVRLPGLSLLLYI